jgi:hypothetical protein
MTSQNVISVQWNVSFIPDSLQSLVWFSRRIPRTKLLFFNVLDKEKVRSVFSWKAFRIFVERILYKGVILLPHAVILGTTELTFRELVPNGDSPNGTQKKWILLSSKEKINLVRSIDAGLLKNRKLATDLLQFLDSRKPSSVSLSDWNDVLVDRVPTRGVPGMGQFDIDGLEGTSCISNYKYVKLVISILFLFVLINVELLQYLMIHNTNFIILSFLVFNLSYNCTTNGAAYSIYILISLNLIVYNSAEQQKDLLNVSNTILGFTTVIILLVGIAFSSVLFDNMQYETPTGGQRMQSIDDYL